ncbi:MAG: hypothetical protein NT080_09035 [Spirochaetes bacterium]|nr:hypothetical protein [Spirochaetota bacterium]
MSIEQNKQGAPSSNDKAMAESDAMNESVLLPGGNFGKGFTELISVEVARLPGFTLVDRERRNAILDEMEFALSGAVDESGAMEISKLLSVDHFVVGSIIDIGDGIATMANKESAIAKPRSRGQAGGSPDQLLRRACCPRQQGP